MFTGIIQELGMVERVTRSGGLIRLRVEAPKTASRVERLESVAVSGVCLSVVEVGRALLTFELVPETARLTTLAGLRPGDGVNLEPSLSISDRLGGQLLFGHVDGVGTVTRRRERAGQVDLTIRVPAGLRKFLVPKGPIAVGGVSLTVGHSLTASTFTVHLIPETLRHTTLRSAQARDRVNVEIDYLAKLVHQFVRSRA